MFDKTVIRVEGVKSGGLGSASDEKPIYQHGGTDTTANATYTGNENRSRGNKKDQEQIERIN